MNTEWKPIASAPKDGSSILGWGPQQDRVVIAWNEWARPEPSWEAVGLEVNGFECPKIVLRGEPTLWQSLPVEPCMTCGGHGMVGGLTQHSGYDAEPCPDCTPAPTSHPIPTGATGDRDWELCCDNCAGTGYILIDRQVAERKTDVQEFKEDCEACEGRGFNIAFEDIPGIAEYVKSCRATSTVATEVSQPAINWAAVSARVAEYAEDYELRGEDDHGREGTYTPNETERGLIIDAIHGLLADDEFMALMRPAAPAAGDAQMLEFVREVAQQKPEKPDHWSSCGQCKRNISTAEDLLEAHAAIAQQKGEA